MGRLEKILDCVAYFVVWMVVYIMISLCWTGAEFRIDGVVHTSKVDTWVACILAYHATKWIDRLEKKMVGERRADDDAQ